VPDLPAGIIACLFDLEGVLAQTAKVLWARGADIVVNDLAELLRTS